MDHLRGETYGNGMQVDGENAIIHMYENGNLRQSARNLVYAKDRGLQPFLIASGRAGPAAEALVHREEAHRAVLVDAVSRKPHPKILYLRREGHQASGLTYPADPHHVVMEYEAPPRA